MKKNLEPKSLRNAGRKDFHKDKTVLLSGGGTGGHIMPALAIAEVLRASGFRVVFVGAEGKMEMEIVPQYGFEIIGLPIRGMQRGQIKGNLSLPWRVLKSLWMCRDILKRLKPVAIIGTGGYASAPMLYMASRAGILTYIQEQNSFPGLTNRMLSKRVKRIFTALPDSNNAFPEKKILLTGNPLRIQENRPQEYAKEDSSKIKTILVLGGSLGALAINQWVISQLDTISQGAYKWVWQCGKRFFEQSNKAWEEHGSPKQIEIRGFIEDIDRLYQEADWVICRAGALTISELARAQKATLFIPSPNVTDNHQVKNAQVLEEAKACILIEERNLGNATENIWKYLEDSVLQKQLEGAIHQFHKPNAAQRIVQQILEDLETK